MLARTERLIKLAEEYFLAERYQEAYKTVKQARQLDPSFGNGLDYEVAYRVHLVDLYTNTYTQEPDWYQILDLQRSASAEAILKRSRLLVELVDPRTHSFAAARGAFELVARAFIILGDWESRMAFDKRRDEYVD